MNGELASWSALARQLASEGFRWVVRRRSPGSALVKLGAMILVAALGGGWVITLTSKGPDGSDEVRVEAGAGVAESIAVGGSLIATLLIGVGVCFELRAWRSEQAERERKRVLVVEQRGLQARASAPLLDAVPPGIIGNRLGTVIDHTAHVRDGVVAERGAAFMEARQLRRDVKARLADVNPADATIVYGGLAPVPLTFLAGATLDDDGCAVVLMDWDRFRGAWRPLDGEDDGDRLSNPDFSVVRAGADEVSLAVSVSYEVDEAAARALDSDVPLLSMRLGNVTVGNHWSEAKQQAIASAFVDAMVRLEALGVRTVHLFLAAPNSVVFRLGRAYDGRNLPELLVSQYERSDPRRFPWAVRMPHHGEPEPALVLPPAMA